MIKTFGGIFDCVGVFDGFGVSRSGIPGYKVNVVCYLKTEFSLKEQLYLNSEIMECIPVDDPKAAMILYGC